jgi:hypothetical protein
MRKRWYFIVPAAIAGMIVFTVIGGAIVKLLWNWLTPPLFGWKTITFWQALALLALCRILVGGFGLRGSGRGGHRRRMRERWEQMSPEERERFRETMRGRCGWGPPPEEHV